MKIEILNYCDKYWNIHPKSDQIESERAALVLCFAEKDLCLRPFLLQDLRERFPAARIAICSSAGEIYHDQVLNESAVAIAFQFDHTEIHTTALSINTCENSFDAGMQLLKKLPQSHLRYVLILSDGNTVNGSQLVDGLNKVSQKGTLITGGLSADGDRFQTTLVGLDQVPEKGQIVAIGFYGDKIQVKNGTDNGWVMFGPEREITKSELNKLYEIDNECVLDLYKKYLGPFEDNVPLSTLLFPLGVLQPGINRPLVRTILSIDRDEKSMTFAGDVPQGSKVRFMKAKSDDLIQAAGIAAKFVHSEEAGDIRAFSLLISCIGRKLILGPRTYEEIEEVINNSGNNVLAAGFYSYGEIAPFNNEHTCQLNNETMTITTFYELP